MDKGKLKGHAALWVANLVWGLNAPIGKSVLWSEHNPGGVSPFALSVYRMLGACLLFWSVSLFLPRERVARRDIVLLLFASVFGIQLNQMLFLWGLSLTSPIDSSIIATVVPVLTMVLATLFLREPITWLKAGGVFLGCAGALLLILVSRHGTGHTSSVKGDVLCLVSAVSYATYLTAFRNVIVKYSPVTTMKWMSRKGDIERKVRSEKEVGKYQIDIVTRFAHGNSEGQLLHQILPIFAASIPQ